uniref:Uncharacterized protein n=1 Tax=Geospiza parvula TaxID=87175 RepID=A0A8U8C0F0_GEOPR
METPSSLNQWPEQHLDVSSTTSSPAHKTELYPSTRQRFNYAWANDDISALTASNLLKRYAEKYSGVLDAPYERPALGAYGDGAFGPVNGQKGDGEPWPGAHGSDGTYPLTPIHDGLAGTKGVVPPAVPAGSGAIGLGGSPVVSTNLSDPVYPGNSCGAAAAGSGALGGSCSLRTPRPPWCQATVPQAPCTTTPAAATRPSRAMGASTHPTPLPPTCPLASLRPPPSRPRHPPPARRGSLPMATRALAREAANRGAGSAEEHKYGGQQMKGMVSPSYGARDTPLRPAEPFEKFSPPLANGERAAEPGPPFPLRLPSKAVLFGSAPLEEQPKNIDPLLLELVNTKVVERGPPVQWSDIAGQVSVKAAIEEELLWPILRPGSYSSASHPLRTLLLFGPRGTGKTLLSRCISTQLGSTLLRLSGTMLLSTWKAGAEKILQTVFFVANCRQPSVVLITEAESLLAARVGEDGGQVSSLKSQLLSYLDNVATSSEHNVVVIGTTARPSSMDEASHRRFGTRLYIAPPDGEARRHILRQALAQQSCCLSERELAALAQRTESFSGAELLRLCQHAGAAARRALPGPPTSYQDLEKAFCKVRPAVSQKELDLFLEWDKMYGTRH